MDNIVGDNSEESYDIRIKNIKFKSSEVTEIFYIILIRKG